MPELTPAVLARCFLRTYFSIAAYNPRGLQNVGLLHALEPGLACLYGAGEALGCARQRYVTRFNCHPFWTPLLVGSALHAEARLARGAGGAPETMVRMGETMANTLSSLGDSLFGGSLLPAWALTCVCLALSGFPAVAGMVTLGMFSGLQAVRAVLFIAGVRQGFALFGVLGRCELMRWSVWIKYGNALLLAWCVQCLLRGQTAFSWCALAGVLALTARYADGRPRLRPVLAGVLFLVAAAIWAVEPGAPGIGAGE